MRVTLPYPPSANRYWRHVGRNVVVSSEARAFKRHVALVALQQLGTYQPLKGPVSVVVEVYRPRRIGDLDNTIKVTLDSLRGIAFDDDKQVIQLHAFRHDDPSDPRVTVTVEAA